MARPPSARLHFAKAYLVARAEKCGSRCRGVVDGFHAAPPWPLPVGIIQCADRPVASAMYRSSVVTLLAADEDPSGLRTLLVSQREAILAVAAQRGASNIRVFGSVARGDHHPGSDVDLLVDLRPGVSLLDMAALRRELSALLGINVDVLSARALLPRDEDVLAEAIPL